MYVAIAGLAALGVLIWALRKSKGGKGWGIAVIVSCMILGAAPGVTGLLPGLVNPFTQMLAQLVSGAGVPMSAGGVYTAGAVVLALIVVVASYLDGVVQKWELWLLAIASMILGQSPLISGWLPTLVNGAFGAAPI